MAEPAKKQKKLSDEAKKRKRMSDQKRSQTRINIGKAFSEWRELRDNEGLELDADLAVMLLRFYKRLQVTSTPSKSCDRKGPTKPPVSSITEESDRNQDVRVNEPELGVQQLSEERELSHLEESMHLMSMEEHHPESAENEVMNDLRNTIIEFDDLGDHHTQFDVEEGDSSDEDFFPSIHLRLVGENETELPEISVDEAVLDIDIPDPPVTESDTITHHKVHSEDDLVGKHANITYNDNLLALAMHLQLPVHKCTFADHLLGVQCSGTAPFRVTLKPRGTGVVLEWLCSFGHTIWKWNSQPTLKFGMQGGDFMLSTNILLSGNNYKKIALLFKFMSMGMVCESTFFRIQDSYCIEPVQEYWDKTRAEVLDRLRQKDHVVLLGDGRMDSPGHCAQFCTYTTIEQESRDVVHIVSVDKRETNRNSVIMEKECFVRMMDSLLPEISIKEVVTDAHPQITALLNPERGKYKSWGIKHSLDIWHSAKSLCKRLRRVGTVKNQTDILPWIKDIVNHFWYCSKHAKTEEQFKMMWAGVLHHVRNEHSWANGCCEHEPLAEDSQNKPWIKQGSPAHKALTAVVLDKRWLTLVKKFLNFRTTSDLESFQNHILMYAAKRMAYSPMVYKTRTLLAAIDYNKHNQRLPACNREGEKIYRRKYNKRSKSWTIYTLKEKKQYAYIPEIQRAIVGERLRSGTGLPRKQTVRPDDPRRMGVLAPQQPPPISELVAAHISRGDSIPPKEDI